MKRFAALLLAVVLCLSMTACGAKADPTPTEINYDTLKVGVICTSNAEDETSEAAAFTKQIYTAIGSIGIEDTQVMVRSDISTSNSALAAEAIEECVQGGCAIIFGTSVGFADAMKTKAKEYPRVTFVGLGDADGSLPNYYAFRIKMYEGAYLSGLVAGIQSESGKLGMIASAGETDPETCQIANAFLLGARVENPDATLTLIPTDAAQSDSKEDAAVTALKNAGCDMVLITTKGTKALDAATANGMTVFTLYTSPAETNESVAYSVMPRLTDMFTDTMQSVLSEIEPYFDNMYVGYADGFLNCVAGSSGSREVIGDTHVLPGEVQSLMMKGTWDVFSGVSLDWELGELTTVPAAIKGTDGSEKIAASKGLPTGATLSGMTWLVQGITVQK